MVLGFDLVVIVFLPMLVNFVTHCLFNRVFVCTLFVCLFVCFFCLFVCVFVFLFFFVFLFVCLFFVFLSFQCPITSIKYCKCSRDSLP